MRNAAAVSLTFLGGVAMMAASLFFCRRCGPGGFYIGFSAAGSLLLSLNMILTCVWLTELWDETAGAGED